MAYIIGDACISCGACESECPVECISAGDDKYVIDADRMRFLCRRMSCRSSMC